MRHARRVDRNHGEVRDGIRAAGWEVLDLSDVGGGVPDLCVRAKDHGIPVFFEVKDLEGKRNPKPKKLTKEQEMWIRYCGEITHTVTTLEQALQILEKT